MRSFEEILDIATERKGSREAVLVSATPPKSADELAAIPDDRWLAQFTKGVFNAGFNWKVIETKWDGFEEALKGFDVGASAMMSDEWFDELIQDTRIVRHGAKIMSIRDNAVFIQEASKEAGGFGRKIGDWPSTDYVGLLDWIKKNGARLGGNTGQYALRFMGKDSFILARDVVGRLIAEGVIDKPPTSQKAMRAVQEAFNTWSEQSGQPLNVISRVLAQSTG